MKRCIDCGSEVYGSDPVCTGCRTSEWLDMHKPRRAKEERVIKTVGTISKLRDALVIVILVSLAVAFLANLPAAFEYDGKKMEILRANGVQ